MAELGQISQRELLEISERARNESYSEAKLTLRLQSNSKLTKEQLDSFIAEARRIYDVKRSAFTRDHRRVLPDLMQDVHMRPANANANANLTRHIQEGYSQIRQDIPGLPEALPERLPHFLGHAILEQAGLSRSLERNRLPAAAAAANVAAAANPGLRRRRIVANYNENERKARNRSLLFDGSQQRLMAVPGESAQDRALRESQRQTIVALERMRALAEEMGGAQAIAQALSVNSAAMNAQNMRLQGAVTTRHARLAHLGTTQLHHGQTVMTGLQQTALTRLGDLHTLTTNVLTGVNETLGLSRDIRGAVGRIESGITDLRRMWDTDRAGLFRLATHNEFVMFAVFFMTGVQFPFLTDSISPYWFAYMAASRAHSQVRGLMRGEYNTLIGGVTTLVTPWIVTATFFRYNDQMSQARLLHDPAYVAAFSNTAETAISAMLRNPGEMLSRLPNSGTRITLPTMEALHRTVLEAFESAGAAGRELLNTLARIDPNWSDPARFSRVFTQYLLGQLSLVVNGASVVLGSRGFAYQGLVVRGAFLSVWQLIVTYILEFLWDMVKYFVGGVFKLIIGALCNLWPEIELPGIWGKTKLGGYEACMAAFGYAKEKQEGGTLQKDAIVLYSSPEAKHLDEEIDKVMWTSFILEINAVLRPELRTINTKILNDIYKAGGAVYSLTLIPELGIGYESRKDPLLFSNTTKLLSNNITRGKNKTRKNSKKKIKYT